MRKNTSYRARRGKHYRKTRQKVDVVQRTCKELGLRDIALFRKAFEWRYGFKDLHRVAADLKVYLQTNGRRLKAYVLRYIQSLDAAPVPA
ncbi:hypothetical protein KJ848_00995 [Patescibacteria group bacterium]|nr:hypothetical protein [Patescibacteria group bacterium]MBU2158743.1 hypothetical protein [Patescibacteria group bacterium]